MSQLEVAAAKPRIPMAFAAMILSELCDRLDDGEDPSELMVHAFKDAEVSLAEATDRRIAFVNWVTGAIDAAKRARDQWSERARKLSALEAAFKSATAEIVKNNPDIPFKGDLGRLAVQSNPPSLDLAFAGKELNPELMSMMGIDDRFVIVATTYTLNVAAVKAALAAGEEISWASLKTDGYHLRVKK